MRWLLALALAACASYRQGSERVDLVDQIRIFEESDDPKPEATATPAVSPSPTDAPAAKPAVTPASSATAPPSPTPSARSLTPPAQLERDARRDFERAEGLARRGLEPEALASYGDFLRRWPGHALADDAQLGIAALRFRQRNFTEAAREYEKVLSYTGEGADRAAEAALGLGESYAKMGQKTRARIQLEAVRRRYEGTVWAERALILLEGVK